MPRVLELARRRLDAASVSLRALNPAAVLDRGYAIVSTGAGIAVRVSDVEVGEPISIRMADGRIGANVTRIDPEECRNEKEDQL